MRSLRLLTLNLLSPDHADWPRRRPVVKDGLARLRPDVVALQECVRHDGIDQAADLLGDAYHLAWHSRPSADDGVGAVLGSRLPFRDVREVDLRVTDRVSLPWAAAVLAEVDFPAPLGPVLLVHHKPTYEVGFALEREQQAVTCARAVEERLSGGSRHAVVLGDFDDTPDSSSLRFWTGRQSLDGTSVAYRDAWESAQGAAPGLTFTPDNPYVTAGEMSLERGRRIDYVLVRCGRHGPSLEVSECRRVFDEPVDGTWASDHFGVFATLSVPQHPPGAWRDA